MKFKTPFILLVIIMLVAACTAKETPAAAPAPTASPAPAATATAALPTAAPTVEPTSEPTLPAPARIEFLPNSTTWYTNGSVPAGSSLRFVLGAAKGQQMTVWLDTDNAFMNITGADGQVFTSDSPVTYWSRVLPASQDYFIEIRSLAQQETTYQLSIEIPAAVIDPALGEVYDLLPETLCKDLQTIAAQALGVDVTLQSRAPFLDAVAGEAGQGCRLQAAGNGAQFASPQDVVAALVNSVGLGWTAQPTYQADGPTGSAAALTRDMGLMLISATWKPDMGVQCPADQPISSCNLTPEQKIYQIRIDMAMYLATFSLDGHWEDAAASFSLDLYQDWKNIYGHHSAVAQNGNKVDSLDVSINGMLKGKVATVQFQSSFTSDIGTAEITYIDVNTIQWKIIDPPDGEYYLPAEATLTRK